MYSDASEIRGWGTIRGFPRDFADGLVPIGTGGAAGGSGWGIETGGVAVIESSTSLGMVSLGEGSLLLRLEMMTGLLEAGFGESEGTFG